jgi:hypothetical protein
MPPLARGQGFIGAAMVPMSELEYTGIVETLEALQPRFVVRGAQEISHAIAAE